MIYFAIPLRSKKSAKNWLEVEKLFNKTLKSIYRQTNPNFKVIIACHDKPNLEFKVDGRCEFLNVSFPTPDNTKEQMKDKYYKKLYIMKRIKELGGGHVMFVDADDLVSNKISEFVSKNSNFPGWYFKEGYVYDAKSQKIKVVSEFHKLCGTSSILKYDIDDLPDDVVFSGLDMYPPKRYIFEYPHGTMKDVYQEKKNCNIKPLPFNGAIYVVNNGENHSATNLTIKSKIKKVIKKLLVRNQYNKINKQIFEEFNL